MENTKSIEEGVRNCKVLKDGKFLYAVHSL